MNTIPEPTATRSIPSPWIAEFLAAHGITFEIGPPMRYDQHGNDYVTLMLGGPRDEDNPERLTVTASSEKLAKSQYERDLLAFLGTRRHIIWRTEPEIATKKLKQFALLWTAQWTIYSRLNAYPERPA